MCSSSSRCWWGESLAKTCESQSAAAAAAVGNVRRHILGGCEWQQSAWQLWCCHDISKLGSKLAGAWDLKAAITDPLLPACLFPLGGQVFLSISPACLFLPLLCVFCIMTINSNEKKVAQSGSERNCSNSSPTEDDSCREKSGDRKNVEKHPQNDTNSYWLRTGKQLTAGELF